ncbi:hypothetical protein C1X64_08290 [Pseudomonas sp. GW456-E7]|nr:hypothetical protein C1X64_08290 [Pseudomonas sp. GW456-E7]
MWRGSLLPLGCEAPPQTIRSRLPWYTALTCSATAAQPSGSKLPRHRCCRQPDDLPSPCKIST